MNSEKLTPYCIIQSIQKRHSNFMSALCPILAWCRFNQLLKLTPYSWSVFQKEIIWKYGVKFLKLVKPTSRQNWRQGTLKNVSVFFVCSESYNMGLVFLCSILDNQSLWYGVNFSWLNSIMQNYEYGVDFMHNIHRSMHKYTFYLLISVYLCII